MPAYRSSAEAGVREAVVERLRILVPGCRIIHEINAESFGNRIDVLAVGLDKIVAVEIKSEKDKLDRLTDQIKAMRLVTPYVISALHAKFMDSLYGFPPKEACGSVTWCYPLPEGKEWNLRYPSMKAAMNCLPESALMMLWREELHDACRGLNIKGVSRMTREDAADAIRHEMTGKEVKDLIIRTLRARACVEADSAIRA